jgi:hypothetical protein
MVEVATRLTDFHEVRGIRGWGPEEHLTEHQKDVDWLNSEVEKIRNEAPERQIVVCTHHCPTTDPRANNPTHINSAVTSGFVTDLSSEPCWTSMQVKLWAFGHTHYNFSYREEGTNKLVIANQKGYSGLGETSISGYACAMVVEAAGDSWDILRSCSKEAKPPKRKANRPQSQLVTAKAIPTHQSFLKRISNQFLPKSGTRK